jgi:glutamate synthase domain-containing protein 3
MKQVIDAKNIHYRKLNQDIRQILGQSYDSDKEVRGKIEITLDNILGQRYIGDGLKGPHTIKINGVPGNDLAAFMDGPTIEVFENGQDGIGNTMNSGKVIIHGDGGDIIGYSMRGGEIYIEKNVGFRCGIHMKSYQEKVPVIVIGGSSGNFLGEYMAGGVIILLGLYRQELTHFPYSGKNQLVGDYVGTGMHGGTIYIRGDVEGYKLGKEVKKMKLDEDDFTLLKKYVDNYCSYFKTDCSDMNIRDFVKLIPFSHRPYGKLYTY